MEYYYDPFPADWYNIEGEYTGTWMMGYSEDSHEYVRLYRLPDKQDEIGKDIRKGNKKDDESGSLS